MEHLSESAQRLLLRQPETGMGFQVCVGGTEGTRRGSLYLVLFTRLVLEFSSPAEMNDQVAEYFRDWEDSGEERLRHGRGYFDGRLLVVRTRADRYLSGLMGILDAHQKTLLEQVVKPNPLPGRMTTRVGDGFVRFSAFRNDLRVRENGGFLHGTYATTLADFRLVPSGFAAVGRYALPSAVSARYAYFLTPKPCKAIMGAVAPDNGQPGGGVEVLFPNGAVPDSPSAYTLPAG